MNDDVLHVITPCTRRANLSAVATSLLPLRACMATRWWIVCDMSPCALGSDVWRQLHGDDVVFFYPHANAPGAGGHHQRSAALDYIADGWTWTLDDDNLVHPAFITHIVPHLQRHDIDAIIMAQYRADGRTLRATPENVRPDAIDTAQYVVRRSFIADERIAGIAGEDGGFIQRIYQRAPDRCLFIDEVACWHNRLHF